MIYKTTLEYLEAQNIDIQYHCRDGFCGACRCNLIQGDIEYVNGEPLAFIRDGEFLPCCSIPTSDIIITTD
ncbi:class I ribonucleotide reductase maintenance protein YfaE [Thalassotalea ponticola]|uniref:class I ribonucleotide reductase maintenance protein YfaE n=1 Tax=Thalassotalea ponticola TaxID=1523392 RepID=UPI0025B331F2|nr:class I ribonucleotide reductase maintenance protein YfaE [Thalassotalea ponticola]MDN3653279.1 class I ribonucleotide reductase maintenance protein YfaE [Thalassotalea ponticola]